MIIREPILAGAWYPDQAAKTQEFLLNIDSNKENSDKNPNKTAFSRVVIAPHAGWYYSGRIAGISVSNLDRNADTVVIIGGHLSAGSPFLFADEDAVRTPFGLMHIDNELMAHIGNKLDARSDKFDDNTVEILVPMAHYFFPTSRLLWSRFPANSSSYEAGKTLVKTARELGRNLVVIGSADLTHYGNNYGFSPKGRGKAALDWVKNTNDAAFINAVIQNDPEKALRCAKEDQSSCSAGAVLGAMGCAEELGCFKAQLLEYGTSADVKHDEAPDSFVSYASILFL